MSNLQQRLGKSPGSTETRLANFAPGSYDAAERTVKATLGVGGPVKRPYGTEVLKISKDAINLDRLSSCGVPLIDSHNIFGVLNGVLGRLDRAWFERGQLVGLISFDDSDVGHQAEGLVARGAVKGISIGYRVDQRQVKDEDGNVVDPERERMVFDENYTFTATRWELLEVSLVSVPADPGAFIRSAAPARASRAGNDETYARMLALHEAVIGRDETRRQRLLRQIKLEMLARHRVFIPHHRAVIDRL